MKAELGDHSLRLSMRVLPQVDVSSLAKYFDRCPLDPYVPGGFRLHRLSCLKFHGDTLELMPPRRIFQSKYINPVAGDLIREYPPLERPMLEEPALIQLVKTFCHFSGLEAGVMLDIHQLRTQVVKDAIAEAAPEGIHRDDVDFLGIFCVKRENITGGCTFIYQNQADEMPLFRKTLRPGEFLLVNDEHVYHYSNRIFPENPEKPAYRDVIILTTPTLMR